MKGPPPRLPVLAAVLAALAALFQVGLLGLAFDKLGLIPEWALPLAAMMLVGSFVNLPLFSLRIDPARPDEPWRRVFNRPWPRRPLPFAPRTIVAVNVGGCLAPVGFSFYLLAHVPLDTWQVALAVLVVAAIAYLASFPVPNVGIVMPVFLAPLAAAIAGMAIAPEHAPSLAYVAGTLGVLIGADLLHLGQVRRLGGTLAAIGGAGTFDGIFITGVVAVLLA